MNISFKEAQEICDQFTEEFSLRAKSEYFAGVVIVRLQGGERCLKVLILKPLPTDLVLPEEYKGLRIFLEAVGSMDAF